MVVTKPRGCKVLVMLVLALERTKSSSGAGWGVCFEPPAQKALRQTALAWTSATPCRMWLFWTAYKALKSRRLR